MANLLIPWRVFFESLAKQYDECLWLVLATAAFLICFYSGTLAMSIVYPLDEAILGF